MASMDSFSAGLNTSARAGVKTRLDVSFVGLEYQNFFYTIGQFLALIKKLSIPLQMLSMFHFAMETKHF